MTNSFSTLHECDFCHELKLATKFINKYVTCAKKVCQESAHNSPEGTRVRIKPTR